MDNSLSGTSTSNSDLGTLDDSSVSLKCDEPWNYYLRTLEDRMNFLVCNKFMSDITFLVGENKLQVPGHRVILSTCSSDFYNALNFEDNTEISVEDVAPKHFRTFLEYCYCGNVDLTDDNVLSLHNLATRFGMKELLQHAETFITVTDDNCIELYHLSQSQPFGPELLKTILKMIENYFFHLAESKCEIFLDLSLDALKRLTSLEGIYCTEYEKFILFMKWAENYCVKRNISSKPKKLRLALKDVFSKINFVSMKETFLTDVLREYPRLFTHAEISNIAGKIKEILESKN